MNKKSQKGYSLVEIGVGLLLIAIFMVFSFTMIRGTHNTYRLVEQRNIALSYLIKGTERELLSEVESVNFSITDNPSDTVVTENSANRKVTVTNIPASHMTLTTVVEPLPEQDGYSYEDTSVRLVTSTIEYYTKQNDASSKKEMVLQTLKVKGE